ncbi:winged helix-turn-helix domain-containing protein [Radicibacter daui]|uniref:winged helix-turn-helix domain-containing protein n=1 Tax=Radicibacter daui TaxID=3064829 RepID=UPI004046DC0E
MSIAAPSPVEEFHFEDFRLLPHQHALIRAGERVTLGSRAYALLLKLVENAGTVVSKSDLIRAAWRRPYVDESNLRVQIYKLKRTLLRAGAEAGLILTIPSEGYLLTARTSTVLSLQELTPRSFGLEIPRLQLAAPASPATREADWPVTFTCPYP